VTEPADLFSGLVFWALLIGIVAGGGFLAAGVAGSLGTTGTVLLVAFLLSAK